LSGENQGPRAAKADCFACRHFYITYDPRLPYGCRGMGFRSRFFPCAEVWATSGETCGYFLPKETPEDTKGQRHSDTKSNLDESTLSRGDKEGSTGQ